MLRRLADNKNVAVTSAGTARLAATEPRGGRFGARAVQELLGYDGAGVGVAVIDSGVTAWHDDLTYQGSNPKVKVVGGQRVVEVRGLRQRPHDAV